MKICSYEHASGREAVLQMLHDILTRFPQRIIDDQGQTFFLHLVVALANEQHQKVSSLIVTAIKKLLGRIGDQGKNSIFEYSLSWYTGEKQNLWSASAQVNGYYLYDLSNTICNEFEIVLQMVLSIRFHIFGGHRSTSICDYCIYLVFLFHELKKSHCILQVISLLVGNRSLGIGKHLESILAVAKRIMESSCTASGGVQLDLTGETDLPFWKEAYCSILMMDNLLEHFPELYFKQNTEVCMITF